MHARRYCKSLERSCIVCTYLFRQAPRGHVIIRFVDPYSGSTLIRERDLILRDRAILAGDLVKRHATDAESGSVIKTVVSCTLRPNYTDLPYHGGEPWPHKPEENQLTVPAEELEFFDFQVGDHILYDDWAGEVIDVLEEVTVRLGNGSVVRVQESEYLEPLFHPTTSGRHVPLVNLLESSQRIPLQPDDRGPPGMFYPGQKVQTKKANLRLGSWLIGSYSASEPPIGVVVEVRATQLRVDWIAPNLARTSPAVLPRPDELLEAVDFPSVRLYNKNAPSSNSPAASSQFGSRPGQDLGVGDYVRFRDVAGAAAKYSAESPNRAAGIFRRIPRLITQGFDMNSFRITHTETTNWIQWQDGSITKEDSKSLTPYLNVDDHEVWIGEMCSLKSAERADSGVIDVNEIGVVQYVNARERVARIRWFDKPEFAIFEERKGVALPGSMLGPLSGRETEVSFYEIAAYPALTKRRGDLVVIFPNSNMLALHNANALTDVSRDGNLPDLPDVPPDNFRSEDPENINSLTEPRWIGEIIDLGIDGLLTVRLGAIDQVEDIRVSVEQVVTIAGDDEGFYSDGGSNEEDEEDEDSAAERTDEEHAIEEIITYEGGLRLDDGNDDEDVWMTDEDDEDNHFEDANEFKDEDMDEDEYFESDYGDGDAFEQRQDPGDSMQSHSPKGKTANSDARVPDSTTASEGKSDDVYGNNRAKSESHQEYNFSSFGGMPEQFMILDEDVPQDHHYSDKIAILSAPMLRRIRKEHAILSNSLPPGIWVRTWYSRMDLLRVLIIGPRGTPYELAPFVIDFHFKENFPQTPPQAYFHSWTHGVGRINPNLYEDGVVCLSVLGTWPENEKNEGWSPTKSSVLQVLVSLLGLVLVSHPYYSEQPLSYNLPFHGILVFTYAMMT